ncbi:MAG: transporter [Proteobacteria bacterium]|nr:transporter [Pseudomonadota bacterium]
MKLNRLLLAMSLAMLATSPIHAKEGGDQYPNGAENWLAGAVPPPGNYFINYFGYYGGKLRDGDGDKVKGASVGAWFDALRFVHTSDFQILGGNWGWHTIVPLVHQTLDLGGPSRSTAALGDITVSPFILSWHRKNWHWAVALDVNLPTGKYESGDPLRSVGANYWSVEPIFAATWMGDGGWEVSAKFMYNIKGKNEDFRPAEGAPKMDYQSGDEFHMDYLVGKRFGEWGVGLSGYYLKQLTNDEIDDRKIAANPGLWSAGRKGEVFAIGPSVSYTTKGGMHFIGQWQHETAVTNRFGGDKVWLKLIMPL